MDQQREKGRPKRKARRTKGKEGVGVLEKKTREPKKREGASKKNVEPKTKRKEVVQEKMIIKSATKINIDDLKEIENKIKNKMIF